MRFLFLVLGGAHVDVSIGAIPGYHCTYTAYFK